MRTEQRDPRFRTMDTWAPETISKGLAEALLSGAASVGAAAENIGRAAEAASRRLRDSEACICYCGAGTPARLGVQDGVETTPTFGWDERRLLYFVAGDMQALVQSVEGAEDNISGVAKLFDENHVYASDVVLAVSASGTTPFTLECLREAKRRGALTIGFANNVGTPVLEEADHPIFLDTGEEPIAGSTRMKAGTAQRVALTTFSTTLMTLMGAVYDGYMVDVQAMCKKLTRRRVRIVQGICNCGEQLAENALTEADGDLKVAVMMVEACEKENAKKYLAENGHNLRLALMKYRKRMCGQ